MNFLDNIHPNAKKVASNTLKFIALMLLAFAVEALVSSIVGDTNPLFEFLLNEAGNSLIIKLIVKLVVVLRITRKST